MKIRNILLFPFTLLFRLALLFRSLMFSLKILRSETFDIPVIGVGNLSAGGTGKTPHTAFIAELLIKNNYSVAILSRGYKRKTKGFIQADPESTVESIGDEPLQYYRHFGELVSVFVCEKRRIGIQQIMKTNPQTDIIIMDDSYQHRYVNAGLNLLLSDYHHPFYEDHLLPGGMLREPRKAKKRADCIIITKCPKILSPIIVRDISKKVNTAENQSLFFSYLEYNTPQKLFDEGPDLPEKLSFYSVFMLTGIANPYPLEERIRSICVEMFPYSFPDHHQFSEKEITKIREDFVTHLIGNKAIITTEKDAQRLRNEKLKEILLDLPIFYYPVKVAFHNTGTQSFEQLILDYARQNKKNQ